MALSKRLGGVSGGILFKPHSMRTASFFTRSRRCRPRRQKKSRETGSFVGACGADNSVGRLRNRTCRPCTLVHRHGRGIRPSRASNLCKASALSVRKLDEAARRHSGCALNRSGREAAMMYWVALGGVILLYAYFKVRRRRLARGSR